jgi:diaminohydroxyphosphoribosylaminopyrimidine deaminase/5-amino-6-(5-phosphoribosylamino)uracil reductase
MRDPNPPAAGGLDQLRAEGVDVSIGGESDRARALNRKWMTWAQERRPWVTLKAGTSLDGKIATRTGQSKWITGKAARHRSLELREENDAILVGVETVIADNPRLTRRLGLNQTGHWLRVVLDSHLRTPADSIVVCSDPDQTLIVHTPDAPHDRRRRFANAGVHLMEIDSDPSARIDLRTLVANLARRNVTSLLVEGGATIHGSFVDTGLVDEVIFFVAPMLIGGPGQPAVAGRGVADLELAPRLRFEGVDRHGDDLEIRATRAEEEHVHRSG